MIVITVRIIIIIIIFTNNKTETVEITSTVVELKSKQQKARTHARSSRADMSHAARDAWPCVLRTYVYVCLSDDNMIHLDFYSTAFLPKLQWEMWHTIQLIRIKIVFN